MQTISFFRHPRVRSGILLVMLVAAVAAFVTSLRDGGDMTGYVLVGELVLTGEDIYSDGPRRINTWPPFFSLVCAPLALLARESHVLARGVWGLLNLVALVVVLRQLGALVHGQPVRLDPRAPGLSIADPAIAVPLLLSARYVSSNFSHMQVNLLLFALTLVGLALTERGSERSGGIVLGLAAAMKLVPLAFVPYFLWRGRVGVAAWTTGSLIAFSATPMLVYGPRGFVNLLATWTTTFGEGWRTGKMNQSVYAMWDRFLVHDVVPLLTPGTNWVLPRGEPEVWLAYGATLVLAVGASVWTFGKPGPSPGRWETLCEWSAIFLVTMLFGPVMWKSYLVVALLPNVLLFAACTSDRVTPATRRILAAALAGAFLFGGAASRDLVGKELAWRLDMASFVTAASFVLLAASLFLRRRLSYAPPPSTL